MESHQFSSRHLQIKVATPNDKDLSDPIITEIKLALQNFDNIVDGGVNPRLQGELVKIDYDYRLLKAWLAVTDPCKRSDATVILTKKGVWEEIVRVKASFREITEKYIGRRPTKPLPARSRSKTPGNDVWQDMVIHGRYAYLSPVVGGLTPALLSLFQRDGTISGINITNWDAVPKEFDEKCKRCDDLDILCQKQNAANRDVVACRECRANKQGCSNCASGPAKKKRRVLGSLDQRIRSVSRAPSDSSRLRRRLTDGANIRGKKKLSQSFSVKKR
ncbi:hypothetical protein C8J56DRAFT_1167293 [Mycena floridula]|nr:hypothetical protein C8J56DRAFT_1167293 [Mycena floridula]